MNTQNLYKHKYCTDMAIEPIQVKVDHENKKVIVSFQYWNIAYKRKWPLDLFDTHNFTFKEMNNWKEYKY